MSITMWEYYQRKADELAQRSLSEIGTAEDWHSRRDELYNQFMLSVGLHPLPDRCDLRLTDYGTFNGPGYTARRLAWQMLENCWATGTVYYPDQIPNGARLPAVLYACGHNSLGSINYQKYGMTWARRGYACLVFDTIEQHDNPGEHHNMRSSFITNAGGRWDWISRGYSAAGGELWNSIRALDALASLPEVDPDRVGVTGVSGGGSMSFYLSVADSRIKAGAPCCGVSVPKYALYKRHILTHCGCLYYHNIFGRDVSEYAGLVAPRALMFCFPRHDKHFSPPEFRFLYERAHKVYQLLDAADNCALFEYDGPHGYGHKLECITAINEWFDMHLAGESHPQLKPEKMMEQPESTITVFNGKPPSPNRLDILPELLPPAPGTLSLPGSDKEHKELRQSLVARLRREVFHLILDPQAHMEMEELGEWRHGKPDPRLKISPSTRKRFLGRMDGMEIFMDLFLPDGDTGGLLVGVTDDEEVSYDLFQRLEGIIRGSCAMVFIELRGTGMSATTFRQMQLLLRAGAMTGITPFMLRLQDLCLALPFLKEIPCLKNRRLCLYGRGDSGVAALYASLLTPGIDGLVLENLPWSHRAGAFVPGILRVMDIDHALGLAAPLPVALARPQHGRGTWSSRVYERLGAKSALISSSPCLKTALDSVFESIGGEGRG